MLVECIDTIGADSGSRYTVKVNERLKSQDAQGWRHACTRLKPSSHDDSVQTIELSEDEALRYRVVGEFVCVIDQA